MHAIVLLQPASVARRANAPRCDNVVIRTSQDKARHRIEPQPGAGSASESFERRHRMTNSYFSATQLLGSKLRTLDGAGVGLLDLMLNTDQWMVRFLVADADAWAPNRGVLVSTDAVADLDEASGDLMLDLSTRALRSSPVLTSSDRLDAGQAYDPPPPPAWDAHWRAEIAPEQGLDPPPAAVDEVESEVVSALAADHDFSADRWIRAELLRRASGKTADGAAVRVIDLVIDNTDWGVPYLDIAFGPDSSSDGIAARARSSSRCLVPRQCIDWMDRRSETLYLAVWEDELRNARLRQDPSSASGDKQVRMLDA